MTRRSLSAFLAAALVLTAEELSAVVSEIQLVGAPSRVGLP